MNTELAVQIGTMLEKIGGQPISDAVQAYLKQSAPSDSDLNKATGYLNEMMDVAGTSGVSLPVTEYSEAFFTFAVQQITKVGNTLGFITKTESGSIYPVTGIYWLNAQGESFCYVIKIEEPEPHDSLESLFSDIADAIRSVSGGTDPIVADQFPKHISAIQTGVHLDPLKYSAGSGQIHSGWQAYDDSGQLITGTASTYEEGYDIGYQNGYGEGVSATAGLTYDWDEDALTLTITEA